MTESAPRPARRPGAFLLAAWLLLPAAGLADTAGSADPHYGAAGFFDIHVCNWPGRPLFFMALFSTERHAEVQTIEVLGPENRPLLQLDLERYRTLQRDGKPDKHVFIRQFDVPPGAGNGWYASRTTLRNGEVHVNRDYVILHELPQAGGQAPAHEAELDTLPVRLAWSAVPGANFYQVFIRDLWNEDALIYISKLLSGPELVLPPGLLQRGGLYSWTIHARDTDSHILLGDFNHGSMSAPATFSIAE